MNKTFELLALSPWLGPALQPPGKVSRILPAEAGKHIGQSLAVAGRIAEVAVHEKLIYLNFEKPFPETPFMAVVFAAKASQFGDLFKLQGSHIEVNGKIISFRERAEIILEKPAQLKVLAESTPK